jgi:hypothetical protein
MGAVEVFDTADTHRESAKIESPTPTQKPQKTQNPSRHAIDDATRCREAARRTTVPASEIAPERAVEDRGEEGGSQRSRLLLSVANCCDLIPDFTEPDLLRVGG